MKLFVAGDKGRAVCEKDGVVNTTFQYRDVPFSGGQGMAKSILVGVCDKCESVVAIPPQSTPAIKAARAETARSIEAILPAVYVDALDLACYRIDSMAATDMRKSLLMHYVTVYAGKKAKYASLAYSVKTFGREFERGEKLDAKKRISMKVSAEMYRCIDVLTKKTRMNRTDLFKCLAVEIKNDIVTPEKPAGLDELRRMVAVAQC